MGGGFVEVFGIPLNGKNSILDFGLWIVLAVLVCLWVWLLFRRKK